LEVTCTTLYITYTGEQQTKETHTVSDVIFSGGELTI